MNRVNGNFFRTGSRKTRYNSFRNCPLTMPKLIFVSLNVLCLFSRFVQTSPTENYEFAKRYLLQYGYISHQAAQQRDISGAVRAFQAFFGINVTGNLDYHTMHIMSKPRCGCRDRSETIERLRIKRYTLGKKKWQKTHLTYKISKYADQSTKKTVDRVIKHAFAMWSNVSSLTFEKMHRKQHADINISFESGDHGDGYPFDGSSAERDGKVLAHAFPPNENGTEVHFDSSETWTINTIKGVNFFQTAVHEIGHALGLRHSSNPRAVMYAVYSGHNANFRLHRDDIRGIQALYKK